MTDGRPVIKKVLHDQYYAVLSSAENNHAYNNLVAFITAEDLAAIVFATGRKTNKFQRITNNARVSLLIDNRANQPSDISRAIAISVIGIASELRTNNENIKELFIKRHPRLREFINDPATAMISVKATEYIVAHFDRTERFCL
jgi:general stress protein 26